MFYTYILLTADGSYYIGSTSNLKDRLTRHEKGECRYTKSRLPVMLVYKEPLIFGQKLWRVNDN